MSVERIIYKRGFGPMDGNSAVERVEPPNYVEDGVGLIARGLYIIERDLGPKAAAEEAQRVISHFRTDWLQYLKKAGGVDFSPFVEAVRAYDAIKKSQAPDERQ